MIAEVLGNLSSLSELSSEGKSGAFFYYTADGKYMMKTVTPKEFILLRHILKGYYDHIKENPETLIVRFLGLHCLRVQKRVSRFRPHTLNPFDLSLLKAFEAEEPLLRGHGEHVQHALRDSSPL